jgi:hypothetical protein
MNEIQQKIKQAVDLLEEASKLARAQTEAFLAAGKTVEGNLYNKLDYNLRPNTTTTITMLKYYAGLKLPKVITPKKGK